MGEKKRELIIVLAMFAVVTIVVVGFVIYTNMKAEKAIVDSVGTDFTDELQQSLDEYKQNANDILEDMKESK